MPQASLRGESGLLLQWLQAGGCSGPEPVQGARESEAGLMQSDDLAPLNESRHKRLLATDGSSSCREQVQIVANGSPAP